MAKTIISLSKARKARQRAEKKTRADANAARFGQTRAERALQDRQADQIRTRLDGHRIDDAPDD